MSASPVAVVIEAGLRVGFDEAHVVGALPRYDEADRMLADVEAPIPYSPVLEKAAVPQTDDIVAAARRLALTEV